MVPGNGKSNGTMILHGNPKFEEIRFHFFLFCQYLMGFKESALHLAVETDQKDVVEMLLKHGADVNVKDVNDKIPLQRAIEAGHGTMAEILKSADEEGVN